MSTTSVVAKRLATFSTALVMFGALTGPSRGQQEAASPSKEPKAASNSEGVPQQSRVVQVREDVYKEICTLTQGMERGEYLMGSASFSERDYWFCLAPIGNGDFRGYSGSKDRHETDSKSGTFELHEGQLQATGNEPEQIRNPQILADLLFEVIFSNRDSDDREPSFRKGKIDLSTFGSSLYPSLDKQRMVFENLVSKVPDLHDRYTMKLSGGGTLTFERKEEKYIQGKIVLPKEGIECIFSVSTWGDRVQAEKLFKTMIAMKGLDQALLIGVKVEEIEAFVIEQIQFASQLPETKK